MRMPSIVLWRSGLILPLLFATVFVQVRAVVITPQNQRPFNDDNGLHGGSSVQLNAYGVNVNEYSRGREGAVPQTQGWGWLGRWLSMGGEGSVVVHIGSNNITLPHRPAAFPSHIPSSSSLPISGTLLSFTSLPSIPSSHQKHMISMGCLPPLSPVDRPISIPKEPYIIALIERGGCDFATKVRSAQDRGSAAVIVGDTIAHLGESDEEGRERESLITMFSPEDTTAIFIPSVFVSRASFLLLRDLLANHTLSDNDDDDDDHNRGRELWIDVGEAADENGALTSLLSFALLMPSLFLLATIAIHRIRLARQREKDRAPPMVVLSLPERIWTPDIVWEKDDSSSERSIAIAIPSTTAENENDTSPNDNETNHAEGSTLAVPAPPPISSADIQTPPAVTVEVEDPIRTGTGVTQTKSKRHVRKYFSKDECAICMDSFEKGDVVRILPCGHVFHKDECDEWLLKWRKLCPTCRADVTVPTSPRDGMSGTTLTPVTAPLLTDEEINENENEDNFGQSLRFLWGNIRRVFGQGQGDIRLEEEEENARQGTGTGEEERGTSTTAPPVQSSTV